MNAFEAEVAKQRAARSAAQALSTDLFAGLELGDYPSRPIVQHAEQRTLAIAGTLEGEYHAWRSTQLGEFVVEAMRCRAIDQVRRGERRVGVKALAEWVRGEKKVEVNNSLIALVARELIEREPELRGKIELRKRTST